MHMIRNDAPFFKKFGEVYFSYVNPGFVKGWKQHREMTQHFAVPVGNLKLVLFDGRPDSSTYQQVQEIVFGRDNYQLVRVPPMIIYSFASAGDQPAMIVNCADIPHRPEESVRLPLDDDSIPYTWSLTAS